MLKENKVLEGSGAYLKLPGYDKKFSQKQFKEVLYSDPNFYNAFVATCLEYLKGGLLAEYDRIKQEEAKKLEYKSPYEAILAQLTS